MKNGMNLKKEQIKTGEELRIWAIQALLRAISFQEWLC